LEIIIVVMPEMVFQHSKRFIAEFSIESRCLKAVGPCPSASCTLPLPRVYATKPPVLALYKTPEAAA